MEVKVVSSSQEIYKTNTALEVYVPTTEGIVGILPDHANLIASLEVGLVRIKCKGQTEAINIVLYGGVVHVHSNTVSILADEARLATDLVKQEIAKAAEDAKRTGKTQSPGLIRLGQQLKA